ncbi:MAG TPA: hypothetical protein VGO09_08865 [Flavisolibacter sp.]|nr:hypothetical protein [Flavisolibacter sp.]
MKKEAVEKKTIILLFIMVLVAFSFAQRDSKKLYLMYNNKSVTDKSNIPVAKDVLTFPKS